MSRSPKDPKSRPEDGPDAGGVSRRNFLKGAGFTVAAVGVGAPAPGATPTEGQAPAEGERVQVIGPEGVEATFRVNGVEMKATVTPMTTLLDLLRNDLDLTGAKRVCDRGSCGACSVHIDGRLVTSCSTLAIDAVGREIATIEGLVGEDGVLTPVQSAFVECDALQCGFCTPGMVMACTALLKDKPKPSREEAAQGIAGNICRCGTYDNILDAVELAASGQVKERRR